jgi:hypothetical protein
LSKEAIFSTWILSILKVSIFRSQIATSIFDLVESADEDKQRFAIKYFGEHVDDLESELFLASFTDIFKRQIENGSEIIYTFVKNKYKGESLEPYKVSIEKFVPKIKDDDLHF